NVSSRLTLGPRDSDPVFSPDGSRVAFSEMRNDGKHFRIIPVAGGSETDVGKALSLSSGVDDWSPDGRYLLIHEPGVLYALGVEHQTDRVFIATVRNGRPPDEASFSPEGRAVTFNTDETGRPELYVKSFPPSEATWKISRDGGVQGRWRKDGRQVYYLALDGT